MKTNIRYSFLTPALTPALAAAALALVACTGTVGAEGTETNRAALEGGETAETVNADESNSSLQSVSAPTCSPSLARGAVPAEHKALLNTIGYTEGTAGHGEDGYNVTFGYHYFSSCAHHPNLRICSGNYCSTAAGRYQFLTTTWNGLGYPNFHPDNQDRGAMKLVARRHATVPTTRALTATEFANVMDRISYEWASLPPGRYGQPSYSMAQTRAKYCTFTHC